MSHSNPSFGEVARWRGYFALDSLKGGFIKERYRDDVFAYRNGTSVRETGERIRSLINHAARTTDFYRAYAPDTPLTGLPVVNKETFRNHYEEFRSSVYRDAKDNRIMTTSGSTGTPLSMIQNRRKIMCNTADSIFLGALGNYRIGEKMAFIRVWVNNVRKSRLRLMMENSIMMDSSSLSDEAIREMLDAIKSERVKCLIGYSSALGEISRYIAEHEVPNWSDQRAFLARTIVDEDGPPVNSIHRDVLEDDIVQTRRLATIVHAVDMRQRIGDTDGHVAHPQVAEEAVANQPVVRPTEPHACRPAAERAVRDDHVLADPILGK